MKIKILKNIDVDIDKTKLQEVWVLSAWWEKHSSRTSLYGGTALAFNQRGSPTKE